MVGPWLASFRVGSQPFACRSADGQRKALKRRLKIIGVERPEEYALHDFRRGHARDLVDSDCSLAQLLAAGDHSPAFLLYQDLHKVQADATAAACILGDSDGDSDDDGQGHRPIV